MERKPYLFKTVHTDEEAENWLCAMAKKGYHLTHLHSVRVGNVYHIHLVVHNAMYK